MEESSSNFKSSHQIDFILRWKVSHALDLESGGNCLDEECLGWDRRCCLFGEQFDVWCSRIFVRCAAVFQSFFFISPMKPLREPARMRALRFGGSDLGHWSVENAGDVETVVWRMLLERCFVLRRSCCGSAVDGAIGGGLISACAAGLSFWIAPVTASPQ